MPIKKISHDAETGEKIVETFFDSRVLKVETVVEDRNWSDTLDYSDYRATNCTYALVWIGPRGVPPYASNRVFPYSSGPRVPRPMTYLKACAWEVERDLAEDEQFAWVDCTNLFEVGYRLVAEADPYPMQVAFCGPEVIESYYRWEIRQKEKADRIESEFKAAREAEKLAKLRAEEKENAAYGAACDLLARVPKRGTEVTVDGFKGKIFWSGVKKFKGVWGARAGVKSSDGRIMWVDASAF